MKARWSSLVARIQSRWPHVRKALARDILIVGVVVVAAQYLAVAWVTTESIGATAVLLFKGAAARQGDLVAFVYRGQQLPNYYPESRWLELQEALGQRVDRAGPALGQGMVKVLLGLPGDRVEVRGREVWLHTPQGLQRVGLAKAASRAGTPLEVVAPQVIPPGHVFVWAPHPDAFDSRYAAMGLVATSTLLGRAEVLW